MIAGLAKPMDTCSPPAQTLWKKLGSPIRRKESLGLLPSNVLVWSHSSPRPIRSAPGVATTRIVLASGLHDRLPRQR